MERNCIFSIIMPIYNVESYLRYAVSSVLAQTYSHFELVLVDDCSPDDSPAICDELAA
ncbi:MAG: glycosyltransferase family 2 protein [Oscillospiraceae bacterium]|nr:glycosyltransferase family 2 protein [Oscillospiraceae bacterium]